MFYFFQLAENVQLRESNNNSNGMMMMTFPSPDLIVKSDLIVKVETEELLPFSPESMHTPSSSHANVSDFEDDSDSSFIFNNNNNNNNNNNDENIVDVSDKIDVKPRSPVVTQFRGPAASTNDLQQKEQNRVSAVDRNTTPTLKTQSSSKTESTLKSQLQSTMQLHLLTFLIWMNLNGPLQTTSFQSALSELKPSESLEIPLESNLPPKKRSHWWGPHRPCPHAKT